MVPADSCSYKGKTALLYSKAIPFVLAKAWQLSIKVTEEERALEGLEDRSTQCPLRQACQRGGLAISNLVQHRMAELPITEKSMQGCLKLPRRRNPGGIAVWRGGSCNDEASRRQGFV